MPQGCFPPGAKERGPEGSQEAWLRHPTVGKVPQAQCDTPVRGALHAWVGARFGLGLIQQHPEALSDPATTLARNLGISRVAKSTRGRLEEAIETAEALQVELEVTREVGD